jgi:hypothetical protein
VAAAVVVPSAELLARKVIGVVAPDELPSFAQVARVYLDDPRRAERRWRRKHDNPAGFGPAGAVALVTPVVALVSGSVVTALSDGADGSVRTRTATMLRRLTGRRRRAVAAAPPRMVPDWSIVQLAEVRRVALERGIGLGLRPARAEVIADAVVGELVRSRDQPR